MRPIVIAAASLLFAAQAYADDANNGKVIAEKGAGGPPCASCHGLDGAKPVAPENPVLAGQYQDYIVRALLDYKSGKRVNPVMKAIAEPLKRKDIDDVAAWFSSQRSNLHFQR
jgi:cytochrome c553